MKLRSAVNAMCRSCTYDPKDRGTAAQQIACCTDTACPLHAVRPINTKEIPISLLKHWNLRVCDLDNRAMPLVSPPPKYAAEALIGPLLTNDRASTTYSATRGHRHG